MGDGGMRKRPTSRFRQTDIFQRRLVITIPRSGVVAVGVAAFVALKFAFADIATAIALVLGVVALLTVIEARHQLRTFRYELTARISEIIATYQIPDDDLRIAHQLGLIDPDEEEEDAASIRLRLSKRT